ALVAERRPARVDARTTWPLLHALVRAGVPLVVFGSVARRLAAADQRLATADLAQAADVDVLVPPEPEHVVRAARVLAEAGFELHLWQRRVTPEETTPALLHGRHKPRAGRADLAIDVCYALHGRPYTHLAASAIDVGGIAVASLHVGV